MRLARQTDPAAVAARARLIAASGRHVAGSVALATGMAAGLALSMGALASTSSAAPSKGSEPLRLEIWPGGGPQRTGLAHTLKAQVSRDNGGGVNGVVVDFEVMEGPGDDDVATPGATPATPDLTCVTEGGSAHHPATCSVSYVEQDNLGGSDAVLAWIDADGFDATVEADLEEGENQHAPGPGGCAADSKGPGRGAEPDATDCVEKRWMARVPATVDLTPETGWGDVGSTTMLEAFVLDQFGEPWTEGADGTEVAVKVLAGSTHGPRGGGQGWLTVGSCRIEESGRCSVPFVSSKAGRDLFCAYLPGEEAACSEPRDAAERVNGADVVERTWGAPDARGESDQSAPEAAAGRGEKGTATPRKGRRREPAGASSGARSQPHGEPPESGGSASTQAGSSPTGAVASIAEASESSSRTSQRRSSKVDSRQRALGERAPRRSSSPRRAGAQRDRAEAAGVEQKSKRRTPAGDGSPVKRKLRQLSAAAAATAERYSFPLVLALIVLAFVALQGRIDRRDPKLRLAPLDSKHDVMAFS